MECLSVFAMISLLVYSFMLQVAGAPSFFLVVVGRCSLVQLAIYKLSLASWEDILLQAP